MSKRKRRVPAPIPGYRTQVGIADVWDVDDPVKIPNDLASWVNRENYVSHVRRRRKEEYFSNLMLRIVVESIGLYQFCGNDDCLLAGGCCSRRVECFEKHQNLLEATVLPSFRKTFRRADAQDAEESRDAREPLGPDWDPRKHAARWRAMQAKRTAGVQGRRSPPGSS